MPRELPGHHLTKCSSQIIYKDYFKQDPAFFLSTSEEQHGFRSNRSTTDALYIVRQIV